MSDTSVWAMFSQSVSRVFGWLFGKSDPEDENTRAAIDEMNVACETIFAGKEKATGDDMRRFHEVRQIIEAKYGVQCNAHEYRWITAVPGTDKFIGHSVTWNRNRP